LTKKKDLKETTPMWFQRMRRSRSKRPWRRERRPQLDFSDFKVDMPEYKGKLDLDELLEWMQIVERIFDFKDVPEGRKVKLVALKLRKDASL